MRKPETLENFKSMIKDMEHRERFVFDCKEPNKQVEIYCTVLHETTCDKNILIQFVTQDSKAENKQSKLLKLWTSTTFANVFNLIA